MSLPLLLRAARYGRHALVAGAAGVVLACGEPTAASDPSTFTADISGAVSERLTGSALASSAAPWTRQGVLQVTLPNAGTISVIALSADGGAKMISLTRTGTELPVGTFRVSRPTAAIPSIPADAFSVGYSVRRGENLQVFMADSGTVTIAQTGSRVTGTFTLYANSYDVLPMPTSALGGTRITPIESGRSPLTITGEFDAAKR
jgi:hypothetical protein